MNSTLQAARDSLAEAAIINVINLPVTLGVAYYLGAGFLPVLGFILLLEGTGLMFIGGAMDLSMSAGSAAIAKILKMKNDPGSDSEMVRKKRLQRAVVFLIAGAVLFVEAFALALPFY